MSDRSEWDSIIWYGPQTFTPQPETGIHRGWWGMDAEAWNVESRSRERTAVGCMETVWGDWSEDLCSWECFWRKKHRLPWKQGTIVDWHMQKGQPLWPLSPYTILTSAGTEGAPARVSTCPRGCYNVTLKLQQAPMLQSTTTSCQTLPL